MSLRSCWTLKFTWIIKINHLNSLSWISWFRPEERMERRTGNETSRAVLICDTSNEWNVSRLSTKSSSSSQVALLAIRLVRKIQFQPISVRWTSECQAYGRGGKFIAKLHKIKILIDASQFPKEDSSAWTNGLRSKTTGAIKFICNATPPFTATIKSEFIDFVCANKLFSDPFRWSVTRDSKLKACQVSFIRQVTFSRINQGSGLEVTRTFTFDASAAFLLHRNEPERAVLSACFHRFPGNCNDSTVAS